MRAEIIADTGDGPWFVQSWYEDGEHRLAFARGADAFRCTAECRARSERCRMPRTPGRDVCRYHGGNFIRGSNPVLCKVGPGIHAALVERHRMQPDLVLHDIEAAVEQLGIDIPLASVWPSYDAEVQS